VILVSSRKKGGERGRKKRGKGGREKRKVHRLALGGGGSSPLFVVRQTKKKG
jgi:hypothetical protein